MRKKSLTSKAKDLGIDLNKTTIGNLVDRLHTSEQNLQTCQTGSKSKTKCKDTKKAA